MIKNTVLRLTLGYLTIIMAISLLFSVLVYQVSNHEVGRGLRRGFDVVVQGPGTVGTDDGPVTRVAPLPGGVANFETFREEQLESASHRLQVELGLLNVFMFAGGAAASYWLARRHIDPIHEAMEAQSRFTSDAAHELRTPLTAMKTELEVGLRDKNLSAKEARGLLESNLEEVDKLTSLTNALLRLAHTSSNNDTSHWKPVALKKLILDVTKDYEHSAKQHDIKLDTTAVTDVKVNGDAAQLREAVIILLDNALKYGRDSMTIRLASRQVDGKAELSVADQGIGIKATDLAHIFDRFYRADQSRTKLTVPGYGLGLSLAKTIVEQHGGNIAAHSKLDMGTTFIITLPVSAPSQKKADNTQ